MQTWNIKQICNLKHFPNNEQFSKYSLHSTTATDKLNFDCKHFKLNILSERVYSAKRKMFGIVKRLMKSTMMCYERNEAPMCRAHVRKMLFGKLCERKLRKVIVDCGWWYMCVMNNNNNTWDIRHNSECETVFSLELKWDWSWFGFNISRFFV